MDAGYVFMVVLLIVCAGWIVWETVTSNRRARAAEKAAADAAGADGGARLSNAPAPSCGVRPDGSTPTGHHASAPSATRTVPRRERRNR
jgi:hypothetical protein